MIRRSRPRLLPEPDAHDRDDREDDADVWSRVTRSRRKTVARMTVVTGYSDDRTAAIARARSGRRQDERGVARHVEDADAGHGRQPGADRPASAAASIRITTAMNRPCAARMIVSGRERCALADLADGDPEQADRRPAEQRIAEPDAAAGLVGDPRHEDDGDDGEADPDDDQRRGRPSSTKPATTGMTAARTPVTGATMPIRPIARPR